MLDFIGQFIVTFIIMLIMMFVLSLIIPTIVIINKAGIIFISAVSLFYAIVDGD